MQVGQRFFFLGGCRKSFSLLANEWVCRFAVCRLLLVLSTILRFLKATVPIWSGSCLKSRAHSSLPCFSSQSDMKKLNNIFLNSDMNMLFFIRRCSNPSFWTPWPPTFQRKPLGGWQRGALWAGERHRERSLGDDTKNDDVLRRTRRNVTLFPTNHIGLLFKSVSNVVLANDIGL